jgi:predicted N-acetyltransferase YhbS
MKLAIEILKKEVAQRRHANIYEHLRKAEAHAEILSLDLAIKRLEKFEAKKKILLSAFGYYSQCGETEMRQKDIDADFENWYKENEDAILSNM